MLPSQLHISYIMLPALLHISYIMLPALLHISYIMVPALLHISYIMLPALLHISYSMLPALLHISKKSGLCFIYFLHFVLFYISTSLYGRAPAVLRVPLFEKPWSRGTTRTQNSSPEYPVSVTRFEIHH